jgi:hypothetical protein
VDELIVHLHLRIQATLLRHVAEMKPFLGTNGGAVPGHGTGVGPNEAEHGPHRCGLPRPVWTEKAEDAPALDDESGAVKGDDVAEPFAHIDEFQHQTFLRIAHSGRSSRRVKRKRPVECRRR